MRLLHGRNKPYEDREARFGPLTVFLIALVPGGGWRLAAIPGVLAQISKTSDLLFAIPEGYQPGGYAT